MKKLFCLILSAIILCGTLYVNNISGNGLIYVNAESEYTHYVSYDTPGSAGINLRQYPSSTSPIILTLKEGSKLTYLNEQSVGYSKVRFTSNNNNYTGWAITKYLVKQNTTVGKINTVKAFSYSSTSITLKWTKANNAETYCIYMFNSSNKTYKNIGKTKSQSFKISGLNKLTSYSFAVRGFRNGTKGKLSSIITVKTGKTPELSITEARKIYKKPIQCTIIGFYTVIT